MKKLTKKLSIFKAYKDLFILKVSNFRYAMEGAEIGLDEERQNLYLQADKIAKEVMNRFSDIDMEINTGKINKSIIEQNSLHHR